MDDQTLTPFERQLSGRLQRYAERAAVPFDATEIAHAVVVARPGTRGLWILPRTRLIIQFAVVLLLLLAAVAAGLLFAASRGPDLSGRNGLIAFATADGITVADADGSDARILTTDAGEVSFPAWSPNGAKIAYWSKASNLTPASLVVLDLQTGAHSVVATLNPQSNPAPISWAPDGMHLAFPAFSELSDPEVMIIGVDGQGLRSVAPDLQASEPSWSPDGTQIAFRALDPTDHEIVRLYVADVNTTAVRPIIYANLRQNPEEGRIGVQLDWSPDGTRIAFASLRTSPAAWRGIAVTDVATGEVRDVTSGDFEQFPIWSPDGRWIAFGQTPGGGDQTLVGLVRPDGSDLRIFANVPIADNTLSWSPDGTHILAFSPDREQLVMIPIDGSSPSIVPAPAGANTTPSWQRLP